MENGIFTVECRILLDMRVEQKKLWRQDKSQRFTVPEDETIENI